MILPTRDLVAQTRETFEAVAKSTGLKLASVTGSQPFAAEQALLVDGVSGQSLVDVLVCTPGRLMDHLAGTEGFSLRDLRFLVRCPLPSLFDPSPSGHRADASQHWFGRRGEQVIDEADRLLNQSFNDWLQVVLARTREAASASASTAAGGVGADEGGLTWEGRRADSSVNQVRSPWLLLLHQALPQANSADPRMRIPPRRPTSARSCCSRRPSRATRQRLPRSTSSTPSTSSSRTTATRPRTAPPAVPTPRSRSPCRRRSRFVPSLLPLWLPLAQARPETRRLTPTPPSLLPRHSQESFVVLPTSSKPLYLLALLHAAAAPIANALVFTKSVESANRLVKLLQFVEDARAREAGPDGAKALVVRAYSSDLGGGGKAGERGRVLGAFAKGEIDMCVPTPPLHLALKRRR